MQELQDAINEFKAALDDFTRRAKAKLVWRQVFYLFGLTTPGLWPMFVGISYNSGNDPQPMESQMDAQPISIITSWVDAVETQKASETEIAG